MKIAVVDGQGGGIGRIIVEKLRARLGSSCDIMALGTNALATAVMLKAGANEGASGESAVVFNAGRVDIITGSIACLSANAYSGELSARMAEAVCASQARKILIPLNRNGVYVAGVPDEPLPVQVEHLVDMVGRLYEKALRSE